MKLGTFLRIEDINKALSEFEKLKSYGFDTCQLVYKPSVYTSEDAQIIRKAARDNDVLITAMFCGYKDMNMVWDNYYGYLTAGLNVEAYRKERVEYIKAASDFAHEIGIDDIIIHAGFVPNNPFSPEYFSLATSVELIAAYLESLGMNLLFETGGESPVTLLRLIKDVGRDNLYVNLDPANMLMYGYANPVDSIYTIGKYVRNIHGKDGFPPTDPRNLGLEVPVGKGMVDFKSMIKSLRDIGYDRYITIEREITGEQQIKDILDAKEYFENVMLELDIKF